MNLKQFIRFDGLKMRNYRQFALVMRQYDGRQISQKARTKSR